LPSAIHPALKNTQGKKTKNNRSSPFGSQPSIKMTIPDIYDSLPPSAKNKTRFYAKRKATYVQFWSLRRKPFSKSAKTKRFYSLLPGLTAPYAGFSLQILQILS
jgi:hypothetical protein